MLNLLKRITNRTYTENGAVTFRTTGSDCLNLFATIGALRMQGDEEIENRFLRAFAENPDLAMKILFYARDIRGGLGERSVFRTILRWLAENEMPSLVRNLPYIAEYGRWDDVLVLLNTPACRAAEELLRQQFLADVKALEAGEPVSLLGKWLPSVNASNAETVQTAKRLARAFGMNDAQYRKALSSLRAEIRIIENFLRERDYTFDYARQPSKAMFRLVPFMFWEILIFIASYAFIFGLFCQPLGDHHIDGSSADTDSHVVRQLSKDRTLKPVPFFDLVEIICYVASKLIGNNFVGVTGLGCHCLFENIPELS